MLDGIDYYPKKSKRKFKLNAWFFVLLLLSVGVYFAIQYFPKTAERPNEQALIVISKAKKPIEKSSSSIIIKSSKTYQLEADNRVKSDRGLDELIQTFEQK